MRNEPSTRSGLQSLSPPSACIGDAASHCSRKGLTASTICEAAVIIMRTAGGHPDEAIEELSRESRLLGLSMRELSDAVVGEQHCRALRRPNVPLCHHALIG